MSDLSYHHIVAVGLNGVIGGPTGIPWPFHKTDMRAFKMLSSAPGTVVLMGSKTWVSLPKALPGRTVLVLSRSPLRYKGAIGVSSLEALEHEVKALGATTVLVAGGGEVYRLTMPLTTRVYLTQMPYTPEGDVMYHLPSQYRVVRAERVAGETPIYFTLECDKGTPASPTPTVPKGTPEIVGAPFLGA